MQSVLSIIIQLSHCVFQQYLERFPIDSAINKTRQENHVIYYHQYY